LAVVAAILLWVVTRMRCLYNKLKWRLRSGSCGNNLSKKEVVESRW
jgi:hypothetical protein